MYETGHSRQKEGCSDDDGRRNYKRRQPDASIYGHTWNERQTAKSIDDILNNCIEQHINYEEKPCYKDNPTGWCYDKVCVLK